MEGRLHTYSITDPDRTRHGLLLRLLSWLGFTFGARLALARFIAPYVRRAEAEGQHDVVAWLGWGARAPGQATR